MSTTYRAVGIATGVLLALMVVRPAKADSFSFSSRRIRLSVLKAGIRRARILGAGRLLLPPLRVTYFTMEPCRSRQ